MKNNSPLPLWLFLSLFTGLTLAFYLSSCTDMGNVLLEREALAWGEHKPASVPEFKPHFVFRKDYDNFKDFLKRVQSDLAFFKKQGYIIEKIEYENGRDMLQREFICYAVIHYKEKEKK